MYDSKMGNCGERTPFLGGSKSLRMQSPLSLLFFLQQLAVSDPSAAPSPSSPFYLSPEKNSPDVYPSPQKNRISPPFRRLCKRFARLKVFPNCFKKNPPTQEPGRARYGVTGVVCDFSSMIGSSAPPNSAFCGLWGVGLVICRFYGYGYAVSSRIFLYTAFV